MSDLLRRKGAIKLKRIPKNSEEISLSKAPTENSELDFSVIKKIQDADFQEKMPNLYDDCMTLPALTDRPGMCIAQIRVIAESVFKYLYKRIINKEAGDFFSLLNDASFQKKVGNDTLINAGHDIRRAGNEQIHENEEHGTQDLAYVVKNRLRDLQYILSKVDSILQRYPIKKSSSSSVPAPKGRVSIGYAARLNTKTNETWSVLQAFLKEQDTSLQYQFLWREENNERQQKGGILWLKPGDIGKKFLCEVTCTDKKGAILGTLTSRLFGPVEKEKLKIDFPERRKKQSPDSEQLPQKEPVAETENKKAAKETKKEVCRETVVNQQQLKNYPTKEIKIRFFHQKLEYKETDHGVVISGYSDSGKTRNMYIPSCIREKPVISIGANAFRNNIVWCRSGLESITIPNSVTSIGSSAFRSCKSLTSITIPNSVTSIGFDAFSGCENLTSITIPNGVTFISKNTFEHCCNLKKANVPQSCKIEEDAFPDTTEIIRY